MYQHMGNIKEKPDVFICESVTVLEIFPNIRKKSYLETLIDASTDTLRRSKHYLMLWLATKENICFQS